MKHGLAEKKEREKERGEGEREEREERGGGKNKNSEYKGKARKWEGTHFEAHAYLSQQPNKAVPQRKHF